MTTFLSCHNIKRSGCALVNQIPNVLLHSGASPGGDSFRGLDNNTPWACWMSLCVVCGWGCRGKAKTLGSSMKYWTNSSLLCSSGARRWRLLSKAFPRWNKDQMVYIGVLCKSIFIHVFKITLLFIIFTCSVCNNTPDLFQLRRRISAFGQQWLLNRSISLCGIIRLI